MTGARVQPPGGSVADRVARFSRLSTAPASTMTVRQPRNTQEPSTTQVTRPRPATAPVGMVAGSTPPCQGTPLPHQVEVQATVAPAATA